MAIDLGTIPRDFPGRDPQIEQGGAAGSGEKQGSVQGKAGSKNGADVSHPGRQKVDQAGRRLEVSTIITMGVLKVDADARHRHRLICKSV